MVADTALPIVATRSELDAAQQPDSAFISFGICAAVTAMFAASSTAYHHWFVIPVLLCGSVIGTDAVDWARGLLPRFDPRGLLGLVGLHFFFLAPLLHVHWDRWMSNVPAPDDWRPWLGYMALVNLGGLVVYRLTRGLGRKRPDAPHPVLRLHERNFLFVSTVALSAAAGAQGLIYLRFGGISGYIASYTAQGSAAFAGLGWAVMIAEAFPILALMVAAVVIRRRGVPSWVSISLLLLMFFVAQMLFGGLRGSRSNTVWALFWAAGIVHFWLRPLPRRAFAAGLVVLISFMYIYGFYKGAGNGALQVLRSSSSTAQVEQQTGRDFKSTVLADLGRSDVQAFLLYREQQLGGYNLAWGRSYAGDAAILIPHQLWPNRPAAKVQDGTEALYGTDSFVAGDVQASRVYGLAGEGLLNFGILGALAAFGVLGLVVGRVGRFVSRLGAGDARLLIAPLIVCLCTVMLVGDLDNVIFYLVKNGVVPALVIAAALRRNRVA